MPTRFNIVINTPNVLWSFDKKKLKAVMRQAGAEVAATAKTLMRSSGGGRAYRGSGGTSGGFRPYKRGRYTASAAGDAPASVTRTLIRSIKVLPYKSGEGVAIRESAFYGLFLEAGAQGGKPGIGGRGSGKSNPRGKNRERLSVVGTRVVAPRPALSLALDKKQASLGERIGAAVNEGIAFKRQK